MNPSTSDPQEASKVEIPGDIAGIMRESLLRKEAEIHRLQKEVYTWHNRTGKGGECVCPDCEAHRQTLKGAPIAQKPTENDDPDFDVSEAADGEGPPEASKPHNPAGLTLEQVGEGYRLLTAEELDGRWVWQAQYWATFGGQPGWSGACTANNPDHTYRVKIDALPKDAAEMTSVPMPADVSFPEGPAKAGAFKPCLHEPIAIADLPAELRANMPEGVTGKVYTAINPPWRLPDAPKGAQWHRSEGWTSEMLPPPYRPMLMGELPCQEDQCLDYRTGTWQPCSCDARISEHCHSRTKRALPTPQPEKPSDEAGTAGETAYECYKEELDKFHKIWESATWNQLPRFQCDAWEAAAQAAIAFARKQAGSEIISAEEMLDIYFKSLQKISTTRQITAMIDVRNAVLSSLPPAQTAFQKPFDHLKDMMHHNPEYAWCWHCNIAMAFYDEGGCKHMGNRAAARFMKNCFDIDMTQHPHYADTQKQVEPPQAEGKPVKQCLFSQIPKDGRFFYEGGQWTKINEETAIADGYAASNWFKGGMMVVPLQDEPKAEGKGEGWPSLDEVEQLLDVIVSYFVRQIGSDDPNIVECVRLEIRSRVLEIVTKHHDACLAAHRREVELLKQESQKWWERCNEQMGRVTELRQELLESQNHRLSLLDKWENSQNGYMAAMTELHKSQRERDALSLRLSGAEKMVAQLNQQLQQAQQA